MKKALEVDLTQGKIFSKIVKFAIPLMLANVLQLLFNAADIAVLQRFTSGEAVAGAGSCGALTELIINLFIGLSVGANVMVARSLGKNDTESVRKYIGMSILIGIVGGTILLFIGYFGARTFLTWMGSPDTVINYATKYMKIYFLGMPIILLYNFCAAILRAAGDTVRPLIYMAIGGIVNVVLNIFFVTACGLDVEGVAIATVVSNAISSLLTIIALIKNKGAVKLIGKYVKFYPREFLELTRVGLPSGLQSCCFNLSNVLIQSSVNSFGDIAMTGYAHEQKISGLVYTAMNAVALSCMSFVGQNFGAKKFDRIKKGIVQSCMFVTAVGLILGPITFFLGPPLLSALGTSEEAVAVEREIAMLVALPYFLCGLMDCLAYSMRSLGKSVITMFICLFWACVFRIIWIETVFRAVRKMWIIFISYPISWILTSLCIVIFLKVVLKKEEEINNMGLTE